MRLSPTEIAAISQAAHDCLPAGTRVYLFGSRTDPARRGGDIDLLIEAPEPMSPEQQVDHRHRFVARLYALMDERRIDALLTWPNNPADISRPVMHAARQQAIELVSV